MSCDNALNDLFGINLYKNAQTAHVSKDFSQSVNEGKW